MAYPVIMPKTGMAMEEGTILRWLKREGDAVRKGEMLLEIETDKTSMEVEAEADGLLLRVLHQAGEVVPVTQTIAWIGQPGEPLSEAAGPAAAPAAPASAALHAFRRPGPGVTRRGARACRPLVGARQGGSHSGRETPGNRAGRAAGQRERHRPLRRRAAARLGRGGGTRHEGGRRCGRGPASSRPAQDDRRQDGSQLAGAVPDPHHPGGRDRTGRDPQRPQRPGRLEIEVARLYHEQGLSQADIARRFGISRSSVSLALKACREQGIVEIRIVDSPSALLRLQAELKERYRLAAAVVAPAEADAEAAKRRVGQAAAAWLEMELSGMAAAGLRIGLAQG